MQKIELLHHSILSFWSAAPVFQMGAEFVGERTVILAAEPSGQPNIIHGEGARECGSACN